ncbi:zinc finger MYM-type protein 1-like [Hydra vulgaris]|uniref:Zinc finger MYM-type protein 1-like n=1 Tax=Hydra vulgaris TaxID=6087 RepID=A0ABM4CBE4_HYDVU
MTGRKFESGNNKRKRNLEEEKYHFLLKVTQNLIQKNSILRHLKPLSDANTQEIATSKVAHRPHPDDTPHLEDPPDTLPHHHGEDDPGPIKLEEGPDTLPHHHGEDDPGPIQLEEDDNGIYGPQPEDDQQPLYVPENNLVEENITFPSTSQIEDPALWPKILMNSFREILVQQGPIKLKEEDFSKDDHGRKFSSTKLTENGYSDWKHITSDLKDHEKSVNLKEYFKKWMDLATRMKKNETVNECNLKKIKLEVEYRQNILKRIISVIKFLASHNLAFQGHTDKLFSKGNGNFLGLIEMISEFDPILQEHLRKIKSHKLFAVEEHFIGFVDVNRTTCEVLTETFLKHLTEAGLDILNCRGQSYDNEATMKGIHSGVQKRIRDINPRAFFVPCNAHSLNLMVCDAAKSSSKAVSFFGLVQEVYNYFSGFNIRWAILMKSVQTLTLKPLSDTRWESRVESLKTLKYEYSKVYDALVEIANSSEYDISTKFQANNLAKQMSKFKFMVSLIVSYDILFQVNLVSKIMQSPDYDLSTAQTEIDQLLKYFNDFRDKGIKGAKLFAMEIAEELEVSLQFEAENTAHEPILNPETQYVVEVFNVLVDQVLPSLTSRFNQLKELSELFGFLYKISEVTQNTEALKKHSKDLEVALTEDGHSNVISNQLFDEIKAISSMVPGKLLPKALIKFILENHYEQSFPNLIIALRILLTLLLTVASAEKSFSKLKLIKTYLRSNMSRCGLTGLAEISVEIDELKNIDISALVETFANIKARKVKFQ